LLSVDGLVDMFASSSSGNCENLHLGRGGDGVWLASPMVGINILFSSRMLTCLLQILLAVVCERSFGLLRLILSSPVRDGPFMPSTSVVHMANLALQFFLTLLR
jgi:hypothetical protein